MKIKNHNKTILWVFSISLIIGHSLSALEDRVISQAMKQVSESSKPLSPEAKAKIERKIRKKIREEIRIQQRRKKRKAIKDKLAGRVRINSLNKTDFIYKIPAWPFEALFYGENDLLECEFKVQEATKAYGSAGHAENLSQLALGENSIEVQDILLASKLLYEGKLDALSASDVNFNAGSQNHYFYLLAPQPLNFKASTSSQELSFKYARHFLNGDLSFGIEVPLKRRTNKIHLDSTIDPTIQANLEVVHPNFFGLYNNLDTFINAILNAQGINFNKRASEWGFSDLKLSCNIEFDSRQLERCLVGASILFPTAGDITINKLWAPQLGNGGFVEVGAFCSALWNFYPHFNPHLFIRAKGIIPARVERRFPQIITYDGTNPAAPGNPVGTFLTLGATEVQFNDSTFSEVDTTIPNFATGTTAVKINKGAELFARVGNTIEHFFSHKASLDTFYDIRLKGKDYISSSQNLGAFVPSYLIHNTFQVEHRVGVNYLYQLSGRKRFALEGLYTFLGRNVPETFEGSLTFSIEF